ncbi:MAG: ATP-dependent DNA helicase [Proteobacteria bacterium]|nr:ATP-dependent DNA helicase [Pseudomonadota bacterium]
MDSHLPTALPAGYGAILAGIPRDPAGALADLAAQPHLTCHSGFLIERLAFAAGARRSDVRAAYEQKHFDIAELFAFTCPAQMAVPTPHGLARVLSLPREASLHDIAGELLRRLSDPRYPLLRETAENATFLARANWPWAKPVMQALLKANPRLDVGTFATGLNVWDRLEEWEDDGPRPPGKQEQVSPDELLAVLRDALGTESEARPQQRAYAEMAAHAFAPRESPAFNNILLAEAGTGLGKTLGYLAPAWAWARKNSNPVWLSTYTKNLQRQLDQETARLIPDPAERREKIVIRKGRENYLCLLNMQESFGRLQAGGTKGALLAALIARWARHSRDGDLIGGDFPSWILSLFPDVSLDGETRHPSPQSLGLTDRRGECIYVACQHYKRCFIEKNLRAARKATLVIANHALVLHSAAVDYALGAATTTEEETTPGGLKRIVFDEGHHLFDAADSAFSSHLTALETAELRRWLRGPESDRRRGRGLRDRVGDLVSSEDGGEALVDEVLRAALTLPAAGFMRRIQEGRTEGPAESFFTLVRQQVLARDAAETGFTLEADCLPMIDGLATAAGEFAASLINLRRPMERLAKLLASKLDDEAAELTSPERGRLEALSRSLRRRGELMVGGWLAMLNRLLGERDSLFVEWFDVEQSGNREMDVGFHSHWIDPTEPLALSVLRPSDGVVITSATLKDRPPELPDDWQNAETRTGAIHLPYPVRRESFASPFDYPKMARLIVVNDVNRENMEQLGAAYRELFLAAKGGALGLFTAISRLRAVQRRIAKPLAEAGLPLFAQHVDPMDTGTLVDLFRAERDACLLGTDAVRDGVDVPGDSLRLIVMDRVPWPTPTILERARKEAFGGQGYMDMTVRLRLRQAFGRLIRSNRDRGCFVILDARLASRFATAFPEGVAIERMGLVDAIDAVAGFCKTP